MNKANQLGICCACLFSFVISTANAVVVDLRSIPMTMGSRSLSFVADGIDVTVAGYHADHDATAGTTTIYGPFTTGTLDSSASFTWPGFGRTGLVGQPGTFATGLGLYTAEDLGQQDPDFGGGVIAPGFDNGINLFGILPNIQFAVFEFSEPVNVSQVIVEEASNFDRAIWAAGGNTAPDLTQDFLTAFAGFSFRNSPDDATDGLFIHSLTPTLLGIQYLAVGTPPDASTIGDLGPLTGRSAYQQFYIEGLNVSAVPVPAAAWLFVSGLLGLVSIARHKKGT